MDPNTQELVMGAAGASGGPKVYVEDVFSTYLYTGNGNTQAIPNGIDLSGKGGLVWLKSRSNNQSHFLLDSLRGPTKTLNTNLTAAQEDRDTLAFGNNGFTLTSNTWANYSGYTYASWTFRKAAKFFDVVTYTGNGSNRTISHSLGSVPGVIIIKRTNSAASWAVYHRSVGNESLLLLDGTDAAFGGTTYWNSTTPTSTEFSLGISSTVNADGGTYVAYLFAHDAGGFGDSGNDNVISCGSYTGNGSANGPEINLGWEPQWVLIKAATGIARNWFLFDTMRGLPVGSTASYLVPNNSSAEITSFFTIDPTPTGFKIRTTDSGANTTGDTYIYIAIRRGPMRTPTDATKVFSVTATANTSIMPYSELNDSNSNTASDACFVQSRDSRAYGEVFDRLRGIVEASSGGSLVSRNTKALKTTSSAAETNTSYGFIFRYENSYFASTGIGYSSMWSFRRAPGFFDMVAYTGTGANRTVAHNLTVVPELMIVKSRSSALDWIVYSATAGNTRVLRLNLDSARATLSTAWNNTTPTASVFTVGTDGSVNSNGSNYIAYLFATCPGVSKVGSYVGTGTTLQVDCGFTNGARFILIKRNESAGDWHVWDAARGIISGNDPFLLLNSSAAENTGTDYIDPLSTGFEISSTAPTAINASGGTYIFLAIA